MANQFGKQLANIKKQRHVFIGFIFLFVIVITWTAMSLFTSQNKIAISNELKEIAKPLTPNIEEEVIDKLEGKKEYTSEELADFPIYKVVTSKDGKQVKLVEIGVDEEKIFTAPTPVVTPIIEPTEEPTNSSNESSESAEITPVL